MYFLLHSTVYHQNKYAKLCTWHLFRNSWNELQSVNSTWMTAQNLFVWRKISGFELKLGANVPDKHYKMKRRITSKHSWIRLFPPFSHRWLTDSTLSLFVQVCELCMCSCAYWSRCCWAHTVYKMSRLAISHGPFKLWAKNGCQGFKYARSMSQRLVWEEKVKHLFNTVSLGLSPK